MCNELNKEKDRLEVNKHHIREDLCQLQLEIKDNVTAVKTLQDTMERLKLAKQKLRTVQHTDTSSRQTTTRQVYYSGTHNSFLTPNYHAWWHAQ